MIMTTVKKKETLTLTQSSVGVWSNQEQGNDESGDPLRFTTRKCRNMWRNVSLEAAETLGLEEKNAAGWINGGRARGPKQNSQRFLFSILSLSLVSFYDLFISFYFRSLAMQSIDSFFFFFFFFFFSLWFPFWFLAMAVPLACFQTLYLSIVSPLLYLVPENENEAAASARPKSP